MKRNLTLLPGIFAVTTVRSSGYENPVKVCYKGMSTGPHHCDSKQESDGDISPFRLLPNVRKFRVKINDWDKLFLKYGIKKRISPSMKFEKYNNGKLNRYVRHQLMRMKHLDNTAYWRTALYLMRHSKVFFVLGLNHVKPRWHREMGLGSVINLARGVMRIAQTPYAELDYRRVYIPKPNGDWRPLGVPTLPWRIYLHNLNQFLVFRLNKEIPGSQHGFRPNQGTLTAWKQILGEVINQPDIYEFDLKKFFDLINLDWISKELILLGLPPQIVRQIYYINTCGVKLPRKVRLNEFEHQMKHLLHKGTPDEVINAPRPWSARYRVRGVPQGAPTSPFLSSIALMKPVLERFKGYVPPKGTIQEEVTRREWRGPIANYNPESYTIRTPTYSVAGKIVGGDLVSVAGDDYNPMMKQVEVRSEAKQILQERPDWIRCVMYADDGLYYGNIQDTPIITPNTNLVDSNIYFNLDKSGWIKRDGKWLKPLKFLGMTYDGELNELRASTRTGSKLLMDQIALLKEVREREIAFSSDIEPKPAYRVSPEAEKKRPEENTWEQFIHSSIAGFIQSRLYSGSWNLEGFEQSFDLDYVKSSWVDKCGPRVSTHLTVFNSTSFASYSLVKILSRISKKRRKWTKSPQSHINKKGNQ